MDKCVTESTVCVFPTSGVTASNPCTKFGMTIGTCSTAKAITFDDTGMTVMNTATGTLVPSGGGSIVAENEKLVRVAKLAASTTVEMKKVCSNYDNFRLENG